MSGVAKTMLAVALTLVAAACGNVSPANAPDGGLPSCSIGSTMPEIQQLVLDGPKCAPCHGGLTLFPTTLDLRTAGLADRVVDKLAESDANKGKCAGRVMVPRTNPLGGLFIEKVEQPAPSCGDPMPQSMPRLSDDEISCIKRWAVLAAR